MNRQEALGEFFNAHPRKRLQVQGLEWTYMIGGKSGAALVILPGALDSAEMGFEYVEFLEEDFRVVAPAYPAGATSMRQLVDGVIAIADAEKLEKVHLVGSSFGGFVAQCLIRIYPERVGKLVLSYTGGPDPSRVPNNERRLRQLIFMPAFVLRYLMKVGMRKAAMRFQEDEEFWKIYMVKAVGEIRKSSFVNSSKRAIDFDRNYRFAQGDIANSQSRVLLLDSDEDPVTDDESEGALKKLYPGSGVYTFDDTGHMASILKPAEYAGVIRAFLNRA